MSDQEQIGASIVACTDSNVRCCLLTSFPPCSFSNPDWNDADERVRDTRRHSSRSPASTSSPFESVGESSDSMLLAFLSPSTGAIGSPPLQLGPASSGVFESTSLSLLSSTKKAAKSATSRSTRSSPLNKRRVRDNLQSYQEIASNDAPGSPSIDRAYLPPASPRSPSGRRCLLLDNSSKEKSRDAQRLNDSMVYLDGPQVYTCAQCRTHLTSHDDIISKSFHGRHGRAYLFDQCVNVTIGPSDDRRLITGLHTVCDIFCKRCKTLVGWTYLKAYEASQKYKEGKYIIEKINLHMEESDYYDVAHPAGERTDRWRRRSMSWGEAGVGVSDALPSTGGVSTMRDEGPSSMIYEYQPSERNS
jgi:Yippee zinc-binding/DNA-binding /Mis18, centromere assembly